MVASSIRRYLADKGSVVSALHVAVALACIVASERLALGAGLVMVEVQQDGVGGVDGIGGAARAVLSPDGLNLYVTAVSDAALAVFGRDPGTGRLRFVEALRDGVDGIMGLHAASPLAVSPDGRYVYAGGYDSNALSAFERDPATGALSVVQIVREGIGGVEGLSSMQGLAMSPDGESLYVVSYEVAVFRRDATTGLLTFVETQENGAAGVDGLVNPASATVSPDGAHVYVACTTGGNAVVVFQRDITTGALAFVEVQRDGVGGVDGLAQASNVAVSPDGTHAYVSGAADNAVALFDRDSLTGHLGFVEVQRDGVGGVEGLIGADTVTVSPDGTYVYVGAYGGSGATMFVRDPVTGRLTFVQATAPDLDGSILVSADGRYVYTSSYLGHVTVFRPFTLACSSAPAGGCRPPTPGKSSIGLQDRVDAADDQLTWKWTGPSMSATDFGDPRSASDYALCVYDASAASQPVVGAVAPAGSGCRGNRPCWRATSNTGFKAADKDGRPQGLVQVVLKQGSSGQAKIVIKGKGPNLHLPSAPPLLPLRIQLQRSDVPVCWEATFSAAIIDEPGHLKATSD